MGLVQLAPNGKAHLIPITILYDGEFYDASAYKAAPVPMALESGTVYEAVRAGVSQGLFTVSSALQGNNTWTGEGTWQSTAELAAAAALAAKKKEARSKPAPEPVEGPPVLRRAGAAKAPETTPPAPPAGSSSPPSTPAPAPATPAPPTPPAAPPPAADTATAVPPVAEEDPDRPVLKRGAPTPADLKKPIRIGFKAPLGDSGEERCSRSLEFHNYVRQRVAPAKYPGHIRRQRARSTSVYLQRRSQMRKTN